jgi:hypothetical protein
MMKLNENVNLFIKTTDYALLIIACSAIFFQQLIYIFNFLLNLHC